MGMFRLRGCKGLPAFFGIHFGEMDQLAIHSFQDKNVSSIISIKYGNLKLNTPGV